MNAHSPAKRSDATPTPAVSVEILLHGRRVRFHLPNPTDHIQKLILQHRAFYEQAMLEDIGPMLPENALVVDVGANIGNHTLFFSQVLEARTIACEPNPAALAILEANITLNELNARVEVVPAAVGASVGTGEMLNHHSGNLGGAHVEQREDGDVPIRPLDAIVGDRHVHLVKIDVEGMEGHVLRGGLETIRRCKPLLVIEAATVQALQVIETILRPLGYRKLKVYNHTPTYLFGFTYGGVEAKDALERLDPRHIVALPPTKTIVAGMATVVGNEVALRAAVMSLLPQVDRLYLYLNAFADVPQFVKDNPKISHFIDADGRKYGDAGKFWGLQQVEDAIYLTCDDDIVYPPDYVARMVGELAQLGGKAVFGVHGSIVLQPNAGYYKNGSRTVFHFQNALMRRRQVHVPGSGTCIFHTSVVKMGMDDFESPNMADIWLARYMQAHNIPAYVAPRRNRWLIPLDVKRPAIYAQSASETGSAYDNSRRQEEVLSAIYPVSLTAAAQQASGAFVIHATEATGLTELIFAICTTDRDPAIFVVCERITDELRAAAFHPNLQCEVHLVLRGGAEANAYGKLLERARDRVKAWTLRGTDLKAAKPEEWRRWFVSPVFPGAKA